MFQKLSEKNLVIWENEIGSIKTDSDSDESNVSKYFEIVFVPIKNEQNCKKYWF